MQSHFMDSNSSLTKLQTMTTPAPDFRALLADDAYAASFQSIGQYRTALLKALATPPPVPTTDEEEEVEELVADLRTMATHAGLACQPGDFKILTRAANMIQRLGKQEAGR
jgi:hypothetical protein